MLAPRSELCRGTEVLQYIKLVVHYHQSSLAEEKPLITLQSGSFKSYLLLFSQRQCKRLEVSLAFTYAPPPAEFNRYPISLKSNC